MAQRRYLSLTEFADELGVSTRTVRRWIADGKLKAVRPSQRVTRISRDEINRFLGVSA